MKNTPSKISYNKVKRKNRNLWLFDAGLHTQHMEMKRGEMECPDGAKAGMSKEPGSGT